MTSASEPVWLKIMEHGAAGEARTKAFLLDRFWVLERSVDIDGADFLIQLRSFSTRFTDAAPPRVGIVQAKYYQDQATTQYIPCRYVIDDKGEPLKGFFAVLHVGNEDQAGMYLLSSREIAETLDRSKDDPPRYIAGKKALDEKFRVLNRRQALDKIQHELAQRSSSESLRFLDRVNIPYRKVEKRDIDFAYTLPIPNSQEDIPRAFYDYRDKLRSLLYDMEEALVAIDNILKTTDPHVALQELEKLEQYRSSSHFSDGLTFTGYKCDLDWEYLKDGLKEHDRAISALDKVSKRAAFLDLSGRIKQELIAKVTEMDDEAKKGQSYFASLSFDHESLALKRIRLKLLDAGEPKPKKQFSAWQSVDDHFVDKKKRPATEVADDLWHELATEVLKFVCPTLDDEE
ncbi:hypothetical protein [Piscinibacter sp. XHJ-5]|uniref:hypothetical protein n=1 Tax=Piscinibacter sp. XHJ-5 TaxID=3037797 RepID=UPI002452BE09|nr:hypothetical protein [Piscinibacter sp. XHJ-5]